jgi:hypothetical protein
VDAAQRKANGLTSGFVFRRLLSWQAIVLSGGHNMSDHASSMEELDIFSGVEPLYQLHSAPSFSKLTD